MLFRRSMHASRRAPPAIRATSSWRSTEGGSAVGTAAISIPDSFPGTYGATVHDPTAAVSPDVRVAALGEEEDARGAPKVLVPGEEGSAEGNVRSRA